MKEIEKQNASFFRKIKHNSYSKNATYAYVRCVNKCGYYGTYVLLR